jgi:hypothetical protein
MSHTLGLDRLKAEPLALGNEGNFDHRLPLDTHGPLAPDGFALRLGASLTNVPKTLVNEGVQPELFVVLSVIMKDPLTSRLRTAIAGNKYPNERLMLEALYQLVCAANILVFALVCWVIWLVFRLFAAQVN